MKQEKLIIPFSFQDRRPLLLDRFLYVPPYYQEHKKPYEDFLSLFKDFSRVNLEYCSGNGQWIFDKAKKDPNNVWIAVERRMDRAKLIYAKMIRHNISNLFLVLGDAQPFTKYYVDKDSIDQIFINFPDPWPKKKHAKNRLMKKEFIQDMAHILKDSGRLTFVTDDKPYLEETTELLLKDVSWIPAFEKPYYINELEEFGSSFFSTLFTQKGEAIHYLQFIKRYDAELRA